MNHKYDYCVHKSNVLHSYTDCVQVPSGGRGDGDSELRPPRGGRRGGRRVAAAAAEAARVAVPHAPVSWQRRKQAAALEKQHMHSSLFTDRPIAASRDSPLASLRPPILDCTTNINLQYTYTTRLSSRL